MQGRMGGTKGNAARGGRDGGERRNGKEKFSPFLGFLDSRLICVHNIIS